MVSMHYCFRNDTRNQIQAAIVPEFAIPENAAEWNSRFHEDGTTAIPEGEPEPVHRGCQESGH